MDGKNFTQLGKGINLKPQSEEPTNPEKGAMYVDTAGKLHVYDGDSWDVANAGADLSDFTDVSDATPSDEDIIQWNGTQWVPISASTALNTHTVATLELTDHNDVTGVLDFTDKDKQVYIWDDSESEFVPGAFPRAWFQRTEASITLTDTHATLICGDEAGEYWTSDTGWDDQYTDTTGIFSPTSDWEGYWMIGFNCFCESDLWDEGERVEIKFMENNVTGQDPITVMLQPCVGESAVIGDVEETCNVSLIIKATTSDDFYIQARKVGMAGGDVNLTNLLVYGYFIGPA